MKMSNKQAPVGIIRVDQGKFKGWRVTLTYTEGRIFRKAVSDSANGGPEGALEKAKQILDLQVLLNPPKLRPFFIEPCADNTSGFNGLSFYEADDGNRIINVAYSMVPGKHSQERVLMDDYPTDADAWEAAKEIRLEREHEIVLYRKRKGIKPFDGSIPFCRLGSCLNRAVDGYLYCSEHDDFSLVIEGLQASLRNELSMPKRIQLRAQG